METVNLSAIRTDGGTQPRAAIDFAIVEEYAQALATGATFPPAVVFFDGTDYWLADGFHRVHAHKTVDLAEIACDVRQGTRRDAILFSVGANAAHGMRRTNEDKRRAVLTMLGDSEWAAGSDREIAKKCAVDEKTVARYRPAPSPEIPEMDAPRTVTRGGTTYTMNTAAIGSRPSSDRPVFDRTDAGRQAAADPGAYVPSEIGRLQAIGATPERAVQLAHDNAHGWISSALWEIERQVAALPPDPVMAARLFPYGHRHTLTTTKLQSFADWLSAFAAEWERIEMETANVAAE